METATYEKMTKAATVLCDYCQSDECECCKVNQLLNDACAELMSEDEDMPEDDINVES